MHVKWKRKRDVTFINVVNGLHTFIGEKLNGTYRANVIRDLADSLGVFVPDFGVLSPEFDSDEGFDLLAPLFFLDADITHNYYEYLVVFFFN